MSVFPENISSIPCRCCGFLIKIQQANHAAPVFCPSCGDEQLLPVSSNKEKSDAFRGTSESEKQIESKPGKLANQAKTVFDRPERRYGILFFTVCVQLAILVFSPVFVQNYFKELSKKDRIENLPAKKAIAESKDKTTDIQAKSDSLPISPNNAAAVQSGETHPIIARKFDVPETQSDKVAAVSSGMIREKPVSVSQGNEILGPFAAALAAVQSPAPLPAEPVDSTPVSVENTAQGSESIPSEFAPPTIVSSASISPNSNSQALKPVDLNHQPTETNLSQYEHRLSKAKEKLQESYSLIALDPERALTETFAAIRMFEDLGQSIPSLAYWAVAQSYASQSWGESLIDSSPPIESLAVSSDSRWLLTQTDDNTVWIWDLFRTQKSSEGFRLDASETPFVKLLFTPDFRLAIGGEKNGTIRIWDTAQKRPAESTMTIRGTLQNIRDLQISPDGRWLAAYGGTSDLQAERFPTAQIQAFYTTSETNSKQKNDQQAYPIFVPSALTPRQAIPVSKHGEKQAKAGQITLVNYQNQGLSGFEEVGVENSSNIVWLWDLDQVRSGVIPQPVALRGQELAVMTMKISADSRWLVTGSEDGTARIYNLKGSFPGADQAVLKGHELGITSIAIPPQGNWVATGSRDNTIRLWSLPDSDSPTACAVLTGHIGWISALAVDQNGQCLISGSYDQTIRIWTLPQGKIESSGENPPLVIQNDQGPVRELLLSKDGKMLVSLGSDASLRVRELNENIGQMPGQELDPKFSLLIRNRMLPITRVLLTPDDQWLVFNYVNQRNLQNSGVRLWPIRLKDLVECASAFGN